MGRLSASLLALVLGAVAALGLVACGSGGSADLLPGRTAGEITENLDTVKELSAEGECIGAENEVQEVSNQVDALGGVDKKLKQALREGTERLAQVVEDCEEAPEEEVTSPSIETEQEVAAEDKSEKAGKVEKAKAPKEAPTETKPETPAATPGKGTEGGSAEAPPGEEVGGTVPPSGGVGPAAPAEGE
jgi:hypothetical protein